jgi:hypothetical protein
VLIMKPRSRAVRAHTLRWPSVAAPGAISGAEGARPAASAGGQLDRLPLHNRVPRAPPPGAAGAPSGAASRSRSAGPFAGEAWRWVRPRRADVVLVVLSLVIGLGLYWAATQAGVLAVGWRPALATTAIYLAAVAAVSGALAGSAALAQRLLLMDRMLPAHHREAGAPGSPTAPGGSARRHGSARGVAHNTP